ncbi:DUF1656 domain-containing protein [Nitrospirillum viridazoti]|uniref:DUF1656 domain-containing protein n=1 Tax=Nitrospirillum viridazoti CBAmc TaxID=1441467 RepID=A0A248K098_9PROT|nr:DUF1656 domain-containing protein [Nitrospirillum amazonense]ASG24230.1 hypothetical protein Y958_25300 [Nitrospirillum amazonense CBAmc]TWB40768.1 uncharacterized protein DUF1656 [Nitrospirillum amazonense]
MIGEMDIHGVFVSPLLVWGVVAFLISMAVRWVLRLVGAYRLVWHRPLFDLAVYVIVLGGVAAAFTHYTPYP